MSPEFVKLELSSDGIIYERVGYFSTCHSVKIGGIGLDCDLREKATHLRLTIEIGSDYYRLYEIEVTGKYQG